MRFCSIYDENNEVIAEKKPFQNRGVTRRLPMEGRCGRTRVDCNA